MKDYYANIILLEDNDTTMFLNLDIVNDYFNNPTIHTYDDPQSFLTAALRTSDWFERPSLLLLDINMPKMFGYEVLDELEDELSDSGKLEVVMLTSSNLNRDLERAERYQNIIGYIEKPLTIENLKQVLEQRDGNH